MKSSKQLKEGYVPDRSGQLNKKDSAAMGKVAELMRKEREARAKQASNPVKESTETMHHVAVVGYNLNGDAKVSRTKPVSLERAKEIAANAKAKNGFKNPPYMTIHPAEDKHLSGEELMKKHKDLFKEDVDRIDELKKSTLASYVTKSSHNKTMRAMDAMVPGSEPDAKAANIKKMEKRTHGIYRAVSRLAKEEAVVEGKIGEKAAGDLDSHAEPHTWIPTGKTATHTSGVKTFEYAKVDKEGKRTGDRHYRTAQGKVMGEEKEMQDKDKTRAIQRAMNATPKKPAGEYERKVTSYLKKKYNEETELAEGAFEKSEENKRSADSAKKQGDMFAHHLHMSDYHDNLAQWHTEKGRHSVADVHAGKSDEHHQKAMKLKEEVEPIQELSKDTLHNYMVKARKDGKNRKPGIMKAWKKSERMTMEGAEQIDELSKDTVKRYKSFATLRAVGRAADIYDREVEGGKKPDPAQHAALAKANKNLERANARLKEETVDDKISKVAKIYNAHRALADKARHYTVRDKEAEAKHMKSSSKAFSLMQKMREKHAAANKAGMKPKPVQGHTEYGSSIAQDYKDQEAKRGVGHVRD